MKGVIVAAGYGTRFLPVTKTIPKEMLPIYNKPAIDFVVEEFVDAGIRDIVIITSRRKKALEDYFDREVELEAVFNSENKQEKLDKIKTYDDVKIVFMRQEKMLGTGHALLMLKDFIKNEPFVVAYPDDLFFDDNVTKKLVENYQKYKKGVIAAEEMEGDVSPYGVLEVSCAGSAGGVLKVNRMVEKPPKGTEPSKLVSVGRYLYPSDFFKYCEEGWEKHKQGEYYHVYALNKLAEHDNLLCAKFKGRRYDTGTPLKYLETVIDYSLRNEEIKDDIIKILKERINI